MKYYYTIESLNKPQMNKFTGKEEVTQEVKRIRWQRAKDGISSFLE